MFCAILFEQNKPLKIESIEFPTELEIGQVLVKLHYSGICGSQLGEINGVKGPDKFLPHLMGHEGCATVLEIGQGVKTIAKDDLVVLHWKKGEEWFWDCLFDADAASNSASWQWVAGTGTDSTPYFRIFNPVTQGQKFDPSGDYIRKYVPELKNLPIKFLFSPWECPVEFLNNTIPPKLKFFEISTDVNNPAKNDASIINPVN